MLILIWLIYFATDVYGHIALKMASGSNSLWDVLFSFWGISAGLAWLVSAVSWMFVLSKQPLLNASTISATTYVLMALAAVIVFKEALTGQHFLGIVCVFLGIYLVTR